MYAFQKLVYTLQHSIIHSFFFFGLGVGRRLGVCCPLLNFISCLHVQFSDMQMEIKAAKKAILEGIIYNLPLKAYL